MNQGYFSSNSFRFLRDLGAHNDTGWFDAHRGDYERWVRQPARRLLGDLRSQVQAISPDLTTGAVIRIRRDLRFGDLPYKTYTGLYCRHSGGDGWRAPGFYLRVGPGRSFLRVGLTAPLAATAARVREAIRSDPDAWVAVAHEPPFTDIFAHDGRALSRPPAGVDPDHALAADLTRREFTAAARLSQKTVTSAAFLETLVAHCRAAAPFLGFVCEASGLRLAPPSGA